MFMCRNENELAVQRLWEHIWTILNMKWKWETTSGKDVKKERMIITAMAHELLNKDKINGKTNEKNE